MYTSFEKIIKSIAFDRDETYVAFSWFFYNTFKLEAALTQQFADKGLHFKRFEVVDVFTGADEYDWTLCRSDPVNTITR